MPIIITSTNPTEPAYPTKAVSGDLILTLELDVLNSGIRIKADFSAYHEETPFDHVVVYRMDTLYPYEVQSCSQVTEDTLADVALVGDVEVVKVRGADPAPVVGDVAYGYDREAGLGAVSLYYAIAYDVNGEQMWRSESAALALPERTDDKDLWLRSLDEPDLSMALTLVQPLPKFDVAAKLNLVTPQNARYPSGSIDARVPSPVPMTVLLKTITQRWKFARLLDSGVLLAQFPASYGIQDFYAAADASSEETLLEMDDPRRLMTFSLQPVRRPPTIDSARYVPGYSIRDSLRMAPTIAEARLLWPTIREAGGYPA